MCKYKFSRFGLKFIYERRMQETAEWTGSIKKLTVQQNKFTMNFFDSIIYNHELHNDTVISKQIRLLFRNTEMYCNWFRSLKTVNIIPKISIRLNIYVERSQIIIQFIKFTFCWGYKIYSNIFRFYYIYKRNN